MGELTWRVPQSTRSSLECNSSHSSQVSSDCILFEACSFVQVVLGQGIFIRVLRLWSCYALARAFLTPFLMPLSYYFPSTLILLFFLIFVHFIGDGFLQCIVIRRDTAALRVCGFSIPTPGQKQNSFSFKLLDLHRRLGPEGFHN